MKNQMKVSRVLTKFEQPNLYIFKEIEAFKEQFPNTGRKHFDYGVTSPVTFSAFYDICLL